MSSAVSSEEKELLIPKWARVVGLEDDDDNQDSNRNQIIASDASLKLKNDHSTRQLWVTSDAIVILEVFHQNSSTAQDFLASIAEPITRPTHIHEYKITPYSLYAAVSVGMETEDIIEVLESLCKTVLPEKLLKFIRNCTTSYGKIKLVLRENKYSVESTHPEVIRLLLNDSVISSARPPPDLSLNEAGKSGEHDNINIIDRMLTVEDSIHDQEDMDHETVDKTLGNLLPKSKSARTISVKVHSFEILPTFVEAVKRRCIELDYPMLEEYDFLNDHINPQLNIDLKPSTNIRAYQEKALSKLFGNGRARSGIIVLPCGAGKTLVGITAACTIKKSCLVLCTSAVAVEQWRQQFKAFSTISDQQIARFTSDSKERFPGDSGVVITTYTMVAYSGKRSWEARKMMDFIKSIEWGFMILDEVHVVPANVFRRVLTSVAAHSKLGLTATLVREDDKIDDLNFLIGPKLYEANWLDLSRQGHIATVQCAEVWCLMTGCFYREYLRERDSRKRRLLYAMNPGKIQACQFLLDFHEKRGDKIIVFSDNVYALKKYATLLKKPYIYGATPQNDRMTILQQFQSNPTVNTLFLSKVGDTSIDLPEATCLIQISSHYGSRRQEAQRLGRILRAKRRNDEGFNAYFYSLVSRDTDEVYYSSKRQQFLIDQGYSFKVITQLAGMSTHDGLHYSSSSEQESLLASVLIDSDQAINEDFDDDLGSEEEYDAVYRKKSASLASLSGADTMAYMEVQRPVKDIKLSKRHKLFKDRYRG